MFWHTKWVFLTLFILPMKIWIFLQARNLWFLFPLALKLSNDTFFRSTRGIIGWEDHHLSEIWQCFHSNNDVFTLKSWRLESMRMTARGKRNHKFRAPKQKKYRINLGFYSTRDIKFWSGHQFTSVFNSCIFFIPPYRFFTAFDILSELREFADKELQEPNKKLAGGHKGRIYILGQ